MTGGQFIPSGTFQLLNTSFNAQNFPTGSAGAANGESLQIYWDTVNSMIVAVNKLGIIVYELAGGGGLPFGNDVGVVDAYQTIISGATLTDGYAFEIKIANTNTGASTLQINALGILPFIDGNGDPLGADMVEVGSIYIATYNSTFNAYQLLGEAKPGVAISNNVIPKGNGVSITDGSWSFSGNDIIPNVNGSNIGDDTHRIDTFFMASNIDYASTLIWKRAGVNYMAIGPTGSVGIGDGIVVPDPSSRLSVSGATGGQNGGYFSTDAGYAGYFIATGGGIGIRSQAGGNYSYAIQGVNTNATGYAVAGLGVGYGGYFATTAAGGVALLLQTYDDLNASLLINAVNSSNNQRVVARADGWAGFNANNPVGAIYAHHTVKYAVGYGTNNLWAEFVGNTATTVFNIIGSNDYPTWIELNGGNFGVGIGATITLSTDPTNPQINLGGYGYSNQIINLMTNKNNLFSGQQVAIGSGNHLVNQGSELGLWMASNTASDTQQQMARIAGYKENAINGDWKGYFSIAVNDGAGAGTTVIERLKIGSNGQLNVDFMATSPAGLVSGDLYYDPLDGNSVKYVP